jgi:CheY-like chemotaxis protein
MRATNHREAGSRASADLMKVLVVEDDPFVREMAVAGLEDAGYEVIEAASGGEALRFLQAGITVDALLTDIRLPGARGWAVARAYRERFPDLPVLYVTGYAEQMQPVPGGIILSKPYISGLPSRCAEHRRAATGRADRH